MDSFDRDVLDLKTEEADLLVRKHHDYGPGNIARAPGGPVMGLAVRLHDKVARLAHLLETGGQPNYEALDDTALDIANYGSILSLVLRGQWPGVDEPAAASEADHIEDRIAQAHEAVFGDPDPYSPDSWPPHPDMQGRVAQSSTGVIGLVVGGKDDGAAAVLRHPVRQRYGTWTTAETSIMSGHWVAVEPSPYTPVWEAGDRVQVAPWSDEDKAGAFGTVERSHRFTDGSSTISVRLDGRPSTCLFTSTELLPAPNNGFQNGDSVTPTVGPRAGEQSTVDNAQPDIHGELAVRSGNGTLYWYPPDKLVHLDVD